MAKFGLEPFRILEKAYVLPFVLLPFFGPPIFRKWFIFPFFVPNFAEVVFTPCVCFFLKKKSIN